MREQEQATSNQSNQDKIYDRFHSAARRYGVRRIASRRMSNGRTIYYPADWDERRTGRAERAERDARIAEIRRSL